MVNNNEFELELDTQDSFEQDGFDLGQNNQGDYNNESQAREKQNKSNWKKMTDSMKAKDAIISQLQERLDDQEESIKYLAQQTASIQSNGDYSEDTARINKMEQDLFLSRNPGANNHIVKILEAQNRYAGMTLEDAWKFVKADLPNTQAQPSQSSQDFDFTGETVKIKKSLQDISAEEALKLKGDDFYNWQKLHGYQ